MNSTKRVARGMAVALASTALAAHADLTAGINIAGNNNANNLLNLRAAGDQTAGVGIYATDAWTDIDVSNRYTGSDPNIHAVSGFSWGPLSFRDSTGASAGMISSSLSSGFNGFSGSVNAMADSADRTLMNGFTAWDPIDGTAPEDSGTLTLSGLSTAFTAAPGGYAVVVYFDTDNNAREATITVGGTTRNGLDGSTFSGTYREAVGAGIDANFAVFSGLTAPSVNIDVDSNTGRMAVNGIVLYAIPEPLTLGLVALGLPLVVWVRRRRARC